MIYWYINDIEWLVMSCSAPTLLERTKQLSNLLLERSLFGILMSSCVSTVARPEPLLQRQIYHETKMEFMFSSFHKRWWMEPVKPASRDQVIIPSRHLSPHLAIICIHAYYLSREVNPRSSVMKLIWFVNVAFCYFFSFPFGWVIM